MHFNLELAKFEERFKPSIALGLRSSSVARTFSFLGSVTREEKIFQAAFGKSLVRLALPS